MLLRKSREKRNEERAMNTSKLCVSLVTYNGEKYLQQCLESIAKQSFQNFELVVLDNGSSDGTIEIIKKYAPKARIIESAKNLGFAAGHNQVLRESSSEYVCVLNQDCALESDYFKECVQFLDLHSDVGSMSGLLVRVPSLTEKGPCDTVDAYGLVFTSYLSVKNYRQSTRVSTIKKEEEVVGVPATAALYRRTALEDVVIDSGEVFDEDFFMYKEDVDLALRLRLRGWRAFGIPSARGYHIRTTQPALFSRDSQRINEWSYRNHLYVLIKDIPKSFWLRNGLWICGYEFAKFFYIALFETKTLRGLRDVWGMRKKMFSKRKSIMERAKKSLSLR